jgi:hypothetical protein
MKNSLFSAMVAVLLSSCATIWKEKRKLDLSQDRPGKSLTVRIVKPRQPKPLPRFTLGVVTKDGVTYTVFSKGEKVRLSADNGKEVITSARPLTAGLEYTSLTKIFLRKGKAYALVEGPDGKVLLLDLRTRIASNM